MSESTAAFDHSAGQFGDYAEQIRGYVRYELVHKNLEPYVTDRPLDVLDVQGGSGIDAAWLAGKGHHVTLLEASQHQLAKAKERLDSLTVDTRNLIALEQGDFTDVFQSVNNYDMVLCHGVAMYQPDPSEFIKQAAGFVKRDGLLSVLEKGFDGASTRLEKHGKTAELKRLQLKHRFSNNLGHDVYTFTPVELQDIVRSAGATVLAWYGVRILSDDDRRLITEVPTEEIDNIIADEYRRSQDPATKHTGQMLHIVARKL